MTALRSVATVSVDSFEEIKKAVILFNQDVLKQLKTFSSDSNFEIEIDDLIKATKSVALFVHWKFRYNEKSDEKRLGFDLIALLCSTLIDALSVKYRQSSSFESGKFSRHVSDVCSYFLKYSLEHFLDAVLFVEFVTEVDKIWLEPIYAEIVNRTLTLPQKDVEISLYLKCILFYHKYLSLYGKEKSKQLKKNLKKISLPKGVKEWFDENNVSFQTNSTNIRTKDLLKNKNVTLKQCESWLDILAETKNSAESCLLISNSTDTQNISADDHVQNYSTDNDLSINNDDDEESFVWPTDFLEQETSVDNKEYVLETEKCDVSENEAALNDKEENVVQVSSVETVSFEKNENEMSEEKLSTIHESPDSSSDSVPIKVNEDEEKYIFPADFIEQESDALKNVNELPEDIHSSAEADEPNTNELSNDKNLQEVNNSTEDTVSTLKLVTPKKARRVKLIVNSCNELVVEETEKTFAQEASSFVQEKNSRTRLRSCKKLVAELNDIARTPKESKLDAKFAAEENCVTKTIEESKCLTERHRTPKESKLDAKCAAEENSVTKTIEESKCLTERHNLRSRAPIVYTEPKLRQSKSKRRTVQTPTRSANKRIADEVESEEKTSKRKKSNPFNTKNVNPTITPYVTRSRKLHL